MPRDDLDHRLFERNLVDLHKTRWAMRAGELLLLVQAEKAKPHPDADRLATLIAEQRDWQRQRHNVDLTRRAFRDSND
jgi:hypothetical protein